MDENLFVGLLGAGSAILGAIVGGLIPSLASAAENRKQRAITAYSEWSTALQRAVSLNVNYLDEWLTSTKVIEQLDRARVNVLARIHMYADDKKRSVDKVERAMAQATQRLGKAWEKANTADHEMKAASLRVQMAESSPRMNLWVARVTSLVTLDFPDGYVLTDARKRKYGLRFNRLLTRALSLVIDKAVQRYRMRGLLSRVRRFVRGKRILKGRPPRPPPT